MRRTKHPIRVGKTKQNIRVGRGECALASISPDESETHAGKIDTRVPDRKAKGSTLQFRNQCKSGYARNVTVSLLVRDVIKN